MTQYITNDTKSQYRFQLGLLVIIITSTATRAINNVQPMTAPASSECTYKYQHIIHNCTTIAL